MKFAVGVVDISDVPGFMRIEFSFTCRECGEDVRVRWDTSHEVPVELFCSACRHVSGELSPYVHLQAGKSAQLGAGRGVCVDYAWILCRFCMKVCTEIRGLSA